MQKIVGNSLDLAEIVVDFDKKDIKILDSFSKKKIRESDLNFSMTPLITIVYGYIFLTYLLWVDEYTISNFIFLLNILLFTYLLLVFKAGISRQVHYYFQKLDLDIFSTKKYIVVKNVKGLVYQLPREYEFANNKFDVNAFGDYKKYIKKVHIKPWEYKTIGISKKKEQQIYHWDAFIYFKQVPKIGLMEITFI
jgi:hypothetical protein